MKKIAVLSLAFATLLVAVPPAKPQVRLDFGVTVPKQIDIDQDDDTSRNREGLLEHLPLLPISEVGLYYQRDLGFLKIGLGARAFSFIAESLVWPNAYAELDLGKASIDAQIGAGAFAMFGILSQSALGSVFIPDISAWYRMGRAKRFRVGGGVIGLYVPSALGDSMAILVYAGVKMSFAR